jgi:predicted nucleic acid-binding protein
VRLFLDTSVLLSASASANGASREIFQLAPANGWVLIATPYGLAEVVRNLPDFPLSATVEWLRLRGQLLIMDDVLTLDRPVIFPAGKDRPILFAALAWADVLLTLDRGDFQSLLSGEFYGLAVLKPGAFIAARRAAGDLR